jgi:hypothetical protein
MCLTVRNAPGPDRSDFGPSRSGVGRRTHEPLSIVAIDVTGDGRLDLVVGERDETGAPSSELLTNRGDGTFTLSASYGASGNYVGNMVSAHFQRRRVDRPRDGVRRRDRDRPRYPIWPGSRRLQRRRQGRNVATTTILNPDAANEANVLEVFNGDG